MSESGREDGAIRAAAVQFDRLIRLARALASERSPDDAAVVAEIAALHGAYNHHGEFISDDFEALLRELGQELVRRPTAQAPQTAHGARHLLHVLTAAKDVGGDSRFVWRWILRDTTHRHSLAVTRQRNFEIPATVREAVAARGGRIHRLDERGADVATRATALRAAAEGVDAVFLHPYVEDVIPPVAFANPAQLPPIAFVMQADHQFLTGLSCSNLVVHMRTSGADLSVARRGVRADRLAFLPIPLEPIRRERTRDAAKRELDLAPDSVLILSIARAGKFVGASSPSFTEMGVALLEKYPQAQMIAIGPSDSAEWREARERTGGRLRALGERSDTKVYYEAADIYLDSYPFASNTSLLEAGGHGAPLISVATPTPEAAVLGAGTPALDETLNIAKTPAELLSVIGRFIEDEALRVSTGERTRERIEHHHHGSGWHRHLDDTVARLAAVPRTAATGGPVRAGLDGLDLQLSRIFGNSVPLGVAIDRQLRDISYLQRLKLLNRLAAIDRGFSFGLYLPELLERVLSPLARGWRRNPLLRRLLVRS